MMARNMVTSVLLYEGIRTTQKRAKAIQPLIDRMIAQAKRAKESGRPIILFPEGTRVPHGERPPLRAGLAGLYKILGLPVIPVALNSGKVWPHRFVKQAGVVTVKVGEPIPPGLPRDEIEARVHAAINALND